MAYCATDVQRDQSRGLTLFSAVSLVLALTMFVCISVVRFAGAGRDDTFIMLWSGKSFTFTNWFVNYNGAREELSSSILGAWMAAIAHRLTPSHPLLLYKTLSLTASVLCLYTIWRRRRTLFHQGVPDFLVPVVILSLALSPMFEYWTLGGLETAFLTFILLLAPLVQVDFHRDRSVTKGILFSLSLVLLALVRTEGFIYVLCPLAFLVIMRERGKLLSSISPIALSVFLILTLFAVRVFYTGALWPNPTYAKINGLFDQLQDGYAYLLSYYTTGGAAAWLHGIGTLYAAFSLIYYGLGRYRGKALAAVDVMTVTLSLYVLLHEAFIVLAGGSWMEYFRFIVPTLPLKVILLTNFLVVFCNRLALHLKAISPITVLSLGIFSLCAATAWQQRYSARLDCAIPMLDVHFRADIFTAFEEALITHNCSNRRDEIELLPFIRNELPTYVKRFGQVRIATYQAGYFPYHLRKLFSSDKVYFIDTVGLANRDIAQVQTKKSSSGVSDGADIDRVLAGSTGKLSEAVLMKQPNMVYVLRTTPESRENFRRLGYELVWDRPSTKIFSKTAQ